MNIGKALINLEKRLAAVELELKIEPDKDLLIHPKSISQAKAVIQKALEKEIKK